MDLGAVHATSTEGLHRRECFICPDDGRVLRCLHFDGWHLVQHIEPGMKRKLVCLSRQVPQWDTFPEAYYNWPYADGHGYQDYHILLNNHAFLLDYGVITEDEAYEIVAEWVRCATLPDKLLLLFPEVSHA